MSAPNFRDLRRAYAQDKAEEEWRGEWAAALFYRPVALFLAPLFLRLSIGANTVTVMVLALALSLPGLALWNGNQAYIWVAIVAALAGIGDCLDGTIARATHSQSTKGHYFDFLTDIVLRISLYASVGLLVQLTSAEPWASFGLAAGLGAGLLASVARLCRVYIERFPPGSGQSPAERTTFDRYVFSAVSGLEHLLPILLLLAGIWDGIGWILIWLLLYSTLDFLHTQHLAIKRLV